MPMYEYQCTECHHVFTRLSGLNEDVSTIECPHCHQMKLQKLFSTFATASQGHGLSASSAASSNCVSRGPFR